MNFTQCLEVLQVCLQQVTFVLQMSEYHGHSHHLQLNLAVPKLDYGSQNTTFKKSF